MLEDIGASVLLAVPALYSAQVEILAGAPAAAETILRAELVRLDQMGEVFFRATLGALLAQSLYLQGRFDEAEVEAQEAQGATEDDVDVECVCLAVRAKVLARRGQFVDAVRLAQAAVEILPSQDATLLRTEALLDLGEVHEIAGDYQEARAALEAARALAAEKRMQTRLARIDGRLSSLETQTAQPAA